MNIPESFIELFSILYALLAFIGALLVVYTAHKAKKKMNDSVVKARVFLNESFLKDNWNLLFLVSSLFFLVSLIDVNETLELFEFGPFVEDTLLELVQELMELLIILSIVIMIYKWFRLLNPAKGPDQKGK